MAPALQRRGIGRALIEAGLALARADGTGAFLSTGTRANVPIYGRCGFRVYEEADAPNGGPHVWFMRWDSRFVPLAQAEEAGVGSFAHVRK